MSERRRHAAGETSLSRNRQTSQIGKSHRQQHLRLRHVPTVQCPPNHTGLARNVASSPVTRVVEEEEEPLDCGRETDETCQTREANTERDDENRTNEQQVGLVQPTESGTNIGPCDRLTKSLPFTAHYEHVQRVSDSLAEVTVKMNVETATPCPCEIGTCNDLIRIGLYGYLGDGSPSCVHCGHRRRNGISPFAGKADLRKHVYSARCKQTRGLSQPRENWKKLLGPQIVYELNDPRNQEEDVSNGKLRPLFRCPTCGKTCQWHRRFAHAARCFPQHRVPIGPRRSGIPSNKPSMGDRLPSISPPV